MPEAGNGRKWNVGDFIHFLEIAALLISIGVNYGRFTQIEEEVSLQHVQGNRIEHYLASQGSEYWHKANENGDVK